MAKILSKISAFSPEFEINRKSMGDHITHLQNLLKQAEPPPSKKLEKAYQKLSVFERIEALLDVGSPFLELSALAGDRLYEESVPRGGIVTGIGQIMGQECIIVANDPAVKGGTYFPITVKKHLRAQSIALRNHLPCIYLVDSGGAFLPKQDEVFPDQDHFGRIFYNQARLSAQNIPQLAIVLGSCTAGGAYVPAMADQVIMVEQQATIFLGGPPLVKAATGDTVTAEDLGGTTVHGPVSGVADYIVPTELEAFKKAREIISHFNRRKKISLHTQVPEEPYYDPQELLGIVPADPRTPYDVREIIARLVDLSEWEEFKPLYGSTLVCGFAYLCGYLVGIIANNGILFSESALKGAHFIELCSQRNIPLIFLQNITGFMVGKKYEQAGIAKHGAKMVHAVACTAVPKFTVIIGNSYGAGNYAMAGRGYEPNFLFMWPNAKIGVMGADQAASVLAQVKENKAARLKETWEPKKKEIFMQQMRDIYNAQTNAYYATARLWDDGVINPLDTRRILGYCISAALNAPIERTQFGVFRM